MATNSVEICNLALQRIGAGIITALADVTAEGKACTRYYVRTLKHVLSLYDWPFATKLASLGAETNTDPVSGWEYVYTVPSDLLRPIRLEFENFDPDTDAVEAFDIRGAKLLTDLEDAELLYVYYVSDTTLFPIPFEEALINKLAMELAMPLTGDPQVAERAERMFRQSLASATAIDADTPFVIPLTGSFLSERN